LRDSGGFYDRRFPLPFGKTRGFVFIGVDAPELLSVSIRYGDQPVMMFPPAVHTK